MKKVTGYLFDLTVLGLLGVVIVYPCAVYIWKNLL
jgi:hypothetical protein